MQILSFLQSALLGALLGLMLAFPAVTVQSALGALTLFCGSVLPALLPFTVCALLLTAGKRLPAPVLAGLSLLGGSPSGARLFQDAGLSRASARRYAAITGVMSPMFFLATLSRWLGSAEQARLVLLCHLLAALLSGLFFPVREKRGARIQLPMLTIPQAVAQGALSMLTVSGCVVMGSVLSALLFCALPLSAPVQAALQALCEVTGGCRALIALPLRRLPLLCLLCAATSFGGLSIVLQCAAFWQKNGLGVGQLLLPALCRAALAFLLCALIGNCLPGLFAL